jgi:hypothetical protein
MNTNPHRHPVERQVGQLQVESEALRFARSIRRTKARTLRHNRKALRLPAGWR